MTKRKLESRAAELGVVIEDDGDTLEILTPRRIRLAGPQLHMLRIDNLPRGRWTRPEMYAVMLQDLEMGVEPCDDPDCDYCETFDDDDTAEVR